MHSTQRGLKRVILLQLYLQILGALMLDIGSLFLVLAEALGP